MNGHRLRLRARAAGIRELGLQHARPGIAAVLLLHGGLAALLQTGEHELAAADREIERAGQRGIRGGDCVRRSSAHHRVRRMARRYACAAQKCARAVHEMFRAADVQCDAGRTGRRRAHPGDGRAAVAAPPGPSKPSGGAFARALEVHSLRTRAAWHPRRSPADSRVHGQWGGYRRPPRRTPATGARRSIAARGRAPGI